MLIFGKKHGNIDVNVVRNRITNERAKRKRSGKYLLSKIGVIQPTDQQWRQIQIKINKSTLPRIRNIKYCSLRWRFRYGDNCVTHFLSYLFVVYMDGTCSDPNMVNMVTNMVNILSENPYLFPSPLITTKDNTRIYLYLYLYIYIGIFMLVHAFLMSIRLHFCFLEAYFSPVF